MAAGSAGVREDADAADGLEALYRRPRTTKPISVSGGLIGAKPVEKIDGFRLSRNPRYARLPP
jgi:hypothetical protein